MTGRLERLVIVGDVHLERRDEDLKAFIAFLEGLATSGCTRLLLMGDLFNLWIGDRDLEAAHHREVLQKLTELRARGVHVRYLEGNRDYRVARAHVGRALDEAGDAGFSEEVGGHRLFAVHGDLANVDDRQYRRWRRFSRSGAVWALFHLLPRGLRRRLADALELRMRGSNLEFKRAFPEDAVRRYSAPWFAAGHDIVVLGHFHIEKDLKVNEPTPGGRILVLPEWRGSRRHLEARADGRVEFVDSGTTGH